MEITDLDNPIDDELMAELRDLTIRMEGLLDRVRTSRFPSAQATGLCDFQCAEPLIQAPSDLLN